MITIYKFNSLLVQVHLDSILFFDNNIPRNGLQQNQEREDLRGWNGWWGNHEDSG